MVLDRTDIPTGVFKSYNPPKGRLYTQEDGFLCSTVRQHTVLFIFHTHNGEHK